MKSLISQKHRRRNGYTLALDDLPRTPPEVYRGAIDRITRNGDVDIAIPASQFLSCAKPPRKAAAQDIIHSTCSSYQEGMQTVELEDIHKLDREEILSACTALVIVLDRSDIVEISHSTIHDFFLPTDLDVMGCTRGRNASEVLRVSGRGEGF